MKKENSVLLTRQFLCACVLLWSLGVGSPSVIAAPDAPNLVPLTAELGTFCISLNTTQRAKFAALLKKDENQRLLKSVQAEADGALQYKPNPIATIVSEGKLASDPAKIKSLASLQDMTKMAALGLAFAATGESKYSDKAREFVLAWARTHKSQGNPINDSKLEPLFWTFDLLRLQFSPAERGEIEAYCRAVAQTEHKKARFRDNWRSHQLKVIGLAGMAANDVELSRYACDEMLKHIALNLLPDGSSSDFKHRDAIHYHIYTLEPLITLAIAAKNNGLSQNVHTFYGYEAPNGASLRKSVDFLVPYFTGKKTHAEFVHSRVGFDKKRADAGEKGYKIGALFNPEKARHVLELASFFEPSLLEILAKGSGTTPETTPEDAEKAEAAKQGSLQLLLNQAQQR